MFRGLDRKYENEFNYENSNIVRISNSIVRDSIEMYYTSIESKVKFNIAPLSYYVTQGRIGSMQMEGLIEMFEEMDEEFYKYLGIAACVTEEEAVSRIHELMESEKDGRHKYYLFSYTPDLPIGIIYVYDYKEKYQTCNLAYGILKEYRSKGVCTEVVKAFTTELLGNGIIRVGLEIEDTNTISINMCKNKLLNFGFKYEGLKLNAYGINVNSLVYAKTVGNNLEEDCKVQEAVELGSKARKLYKVDSSESNEIPTDSLLVIKSKLKSMEVMIKEADNKNKRLNMLNNCWKMAQDIFEIGLTHLLNCNGYTVDKHTTTFSMCGMCEDYNVELPTGNIDKVVRLVDKTVFTLKQDGFIGEELYTQTNEIMSACNNFHVFLLKNTKK